MGNSAETITYSILETLSFSGLLNTGMATTHLWAIRSLWAGNALFVYPHILPLYRRRLIMSYSTRTHVFLFPTIPTAFLNLPGKLR